MSSGIELRKNSSSLKKFRENPWAFTVVTYTMIYKNIRESIVIAHICQREFRDIAPLRYLRRWKVCIVIDDAAVAARLSEFVISTFHSRWQQITWCHLNQWAETMGCQVVTLETRMHGLSTGKRSFWIICDIMNNWCQSRNNVKC